MNTGSSWVFFGLACVAGGVVLAVLTGGRAGLILIVGGAAAVVRILQRQGG